MLQYFILTQEVTIGQIRSEALNLFCTPPIADIHHSCLLQRRTAEQKLGQRFFIGLELSQFYKQYFFFL